MPVQQALAAIKMVDVPHRFRVAQPDDAATVSAVLTAAAQRLIDRGRALWLLQDVALPAIASQVAEGLYHVGEQAGEVVGVFRLDPQDALFWPEMPLGSAAYLHKLAVVPQRQGDNLAHRLLTHAVDLTRQRGMPFLRLDCIADRPALRGVYERFGFRHRSQKQLGSGRYERFELPVTPKALKPVSSTSTS